MKSMTDPIRVPANPFWSVFRRFGRDELTGAVVALIATGALELYFHLTGLTASVLLLALAGPVVEKIGFFFWHIKEAWDSYRTTLPADRKPFRAYARSAFRGGAKTLVEDILVHDPIYVVLMYFGIQVHPETPAWLLVPVAFTIAVVAVAFLEVGWTELQYRLFQRRLFKHRFEKEGYVESRFHLDPSADPDEVLEKLRENFMSEATPFELLYSDTYYKADLPCFNGRCPKVRFRVRDKCKGDGLFVTAQVIYTRAEEQELDKPEQFRLFPSRKDKFYHLVELPDRKTADDLADNLLWWDSIGLSCVKEPTKKIVFKRRIIRDPNSLFISVDTICESGTIVVEIKAYHENCRLLKEAMRFIMHRFPVLQTTHGKADLVASG